MDQAFPVNIYDGRGEVVPTITERPLRAVTRAAGFVAREVVIPAVAIATLLLAIIGAGLANLRGD